MGDRWPSREEWAKQRRTACYLDHQKISDRISDYATTAEIEALQIALRERWKQLGREIRKLGGRGEAGTRELCYKRQSINRGLKLVRNGELPLALEDHGASDLLSELHARYAERQCD